MDGWMNVRSREHVPDALGSALDGAAHGDAAAGIGGGGGGAGDQGLPEEAGGLVKRRRGHRRSVCEHGAAQWSVRNVRWRWWWWEWPVWGGDLYTTTGRRLNGARRDWWMRGAPRPRRGHWLPPRLSGYRAPGRPMGGCQVEAKIAPPKSNAIWSLDQTAQQSRSSPLYLLLLLN